MKKESNYHDATTGKFVTAEYAKENPDTTVEVSEHNLKLILTKFLDYVSEQGTDTAFMEQKAFIDIYIENLKQ